jgi:oligopeptide/dipeptide ABC transporter ATP-binding protein
MTQSFHPPLLSVRDLTVRLPLGSRFVPAVDSVSFDLAKGESLGIAGESGCGKTLLGRGLLNLAPDGARVSGALLWEGQDLLRLPDREWDRIRGGRIGMVFQEPGAALDPVQTVGDQIREAIRLHERISARQARQLALERLREVAFPDPERGLDEYPHRLSGGMRQRAMIAVALAANPELLVADEPTTALDATVAAEVLALLERLRDRRGLTLLLISHDLGLVARACRRVLVLYAGRVVEEAGTAEMFSSPRHPYTRALLRCLPRLDVRAPLDPGRRFETIGGAVEGLFERKGSRCGFAGRCPERFDPCEKSVPPLYPAGGALVRCFLYERERAGAAR